MYEKPKRNDVEHYIARFNDRIDATVLTVSQQWDLDFIILRKECISEARRLNYEYSDDMGAQGFFKWFNELSTVTAKKIIKEASQEKEKPVQVEAPMDRFLEHDKPIYAGEVITPEQETNHDNNLNNEAMAKKTKVCSSCERSKPLDEFYNNKNASDGKSSACKKCLNESTRLSKEKKKNGTGAKTTKKKAPIIESSVSLLGFSNDEIEMMINRLTPALEEAEATLAKAQAEVDRIKGTIKKLEARIKR